MTSVDALRRAFIVGCPRSGTTLIQSLLAAHPQITSFPESHFFSNLPARHPWRRLWGLPSSGLEPAIEIFFDELGIDHPDIPEWVITQSQYCDWFVGALDRLARRRDAGVWIEKTPQHLYFIDTIEEALPAPRFIHVVRSGVNVVASLFAATNDYPEEWGGAFDIDKCIDRWLGAVNRADAHVFRANHTVINYERLVEQPETALRELVEFLDVTYATSMLEDYRTAADRVIRSFEEWKQATRQPLYNANGTKFYERFTSNQRRYILDRLERADPRWPVLPEGSDAEKAVRGNFE